MNIYKGATSQVSFTAVTREDLAWIYDDERIEAAIHEAGHAVVGRALGWRVTSITLWPGKDRKGKIVNGGSCTTFKPGPVAQPPRERLVVDMAGAVASALCAVTGHGLELARRSAYLDLRNSRHYAKKAGIDLLHYPEALDMAMTLCARILRERWFAVERTAAALLRSGVIFGPDADRLPSGVRELPRLRRRYEIIDASGDGALLVTVDHGSPRRRGKRRNSVTPAPHCLIAGGNGGNTL